MQKDVVSIITPCYNTGNIIYRLLDSILNQDYPLIKMLVVDDGSTDNSKEVITSYIPRFKERGYVLEYWYQSNQGQSSAINSALKWVDGEFLTCPDSDDYYSCNDAISMYVRTLRKLSNDFGVVRCIPNYIDENTLQYLKIDTSYVDRGYEQFTNCLFCKNYIWTNYFIKMSAFDDCNPLRDIYVEKDAGQNWQMLLPILYKYKCYTLEEPFFNILSRAESHSRGQYKTYEEKCKKTYSYMNTILFTLERTLFSSKMEKEKYAKEIKKKYNHKLLILAILNEHKLDAFIYKKRLDKMNYSFSIIDRLLWILLKIPFLVKFFFFIKHNIVHR